ncbi:LOW QUALITY PROTEIN: mitochondrial ribosomal protein S6 [Dermatophagoides farinae]|uniref:Small ribosomal subunit protein bS6m n=1 Tax=Dermatophagoides farinae TaxID=6954 RepID=A0A922I716_DERFA|nr:probable 28S ribosomal protein S6, mitochondrial [Dermatophagoides farinae]KAH7639075.1 mitochondrial ribosomal protein s6-like protein [Dermatophagoides farinae]KAH9522478.1 hypothetical protein DERF_006044 [Dermatophagoides farinae]
MPAYELVLLIKKLQKPELASCMKRAANFIFDNNGILRKMEYFGLQPLHFRLSSSIPNAKRFNQANFLLYHLDLPQESMKKVFEDCRYDTDIIRAYFVKKESNLPDGYHCTLNDELKPPALRPSVMSLIEEGRKKKVDYNMGDSKNVRQIL